MRARVVAGGVAVVLATSVLAPPVLAQSAAEKAAAEGLFDQGRSAMQEGDFGKACGLLERSQHIDPAIGTLLYLAECYEKSGRTASAWATFREASDAANSAKETARARTGRERAQRLEPILSRLTIQVAPETAQLSGLTIDQRDKQVQSALFNVPVPTDPGEYKVTASAPGYETWTGTVTVPDKAGRVSISIPALRKSEGSDKNATTGTVVPPPSGQAPAPDNAFRSDAELSSTPLEPRSDGQRTIGLIVGGVGLVGVGIGSVFGLQAFSKYSDAKKHCPKGFQCDDADGPALADDARSAATVSTILFGIGGAALVGGAVLYFTAPSARTGKANDGLRASVGPNGITLKGSFQ